MKVLRNAFLMSVFISNSNKLLLYTEYIELKRVEHLTWWSPGEVLLLFKLHAIRIVPKNLKNATGTWYKYIINSESLSRRVD